MTSREVTLVEAEEATKAGSQGLAAARLARQVATLLQQCHAASGKSARQLAADLDLTEGRVSQVLKGDGNVRISTLARFLRASGFALRIEAVPVHGVADSGSRRRPSRARRRERITPQPQERRCAPGPDAAVAGIDLTLKAYERHLVGHWHSPQEEPTSRRRALYR